MRNQLLLLLLLPAFLRAQETVYYPNGYLFIDQEFRKQDFYTTGNELHFGQPTRHDRRVDLVGKYVTPPFSETHNHSIDGAFMLPGKVKTFLDQGIFYYKNPNSVPATTDPIRDRINLPTSLDVRFANGGWTGTGGHPVPLYRQLWNNGLYWNFPGQPRDSALHQQAHWVADTRAEVDAQWSAYLAQNPDFTKVYVLHTEAYDPMVADTLDGSNGLPPDLVAYVVAKAHAAGRRVSAHVESAADFRVAVAAGVDEINHLPGYGSVGEPGEKVLTPELAQLAADSNVTLVATYGLTDLFYADRPDTSKTNPIKRLQRQNLATLRAAGLYPTVGSDNYMSTSRSEFYYLAAFELYTPAELLWMWTEHSARTIFPTRKIGALRAGYEASFLTFPGNPLEDLDLLKTPELRVKEGVALE